MMVECSRPLRHALFEGRSSLNSNQWDALFVGFSKRRRDERDRHELSRELVAWYDEQTRLVMALVREVINERASAFKETAGVDVEIRWPSHPPINIDPDGPFMSFMSLGVAGREVHLYSHRVGMDPPMVHYVVTDADKSRGLVSRPGCRIERRENGGFLLRALNSDKHDDTLSVDDIAFRAFQLLLA
jgi:hypothetical protein